MPRLPHLVLVPVVAALLLAGALPAAQGGERALPVTVTVHDGRTSDPVVDISEVRLDASWYWDSEQYVRVKVPHGFQPGHRLTVWFDLNGDATPDGHYQLDLRSPAHPGGSSLQKVEQFRVGGGWGHGGNRVPCTSDEGGSPAAGQIRRGTHAVNLALDLWSCLQVPAPGGSDQGWWRAAVSVAMGRKADMAPDHRHWSAPLAGWTPCDPSGGQC